MDLVWYAAYGSNLDRRRMLCYVEGGCPPGATRTYDGCDDPTPPRADRPVTLPFPLYFAGRSSVWGGGVAFLGLDPGDTTLGRAWLLTLGQLGDVACQENGARPTGEPLDIDRVRSRGSVAAGRGWYDRLVWCGEEDGLAVVTLTSSTVREPAAPARAYVDCMVAGLVDSHGLTPGDARAYVAARAGTVKRA